MMPIAVYRCYDASGALLYVGVTTDVRLRLKLHRSNGKSPWVSRVETVAHEWYDDRVDALLAERIATLTESPEFPSCVTGPTAMASAIRGLGSDASKAASWKCSAADLFADWCRKLSDSGYADETSLTPPSTSPFDDDEYDRRSQALMGECAERLAVCVGLHPATT